MIICSKHHLTGLKMTCCHVNEILENGGLFAFFLVETDNILMPKVNLCEKCRDRWLILQTDEERDFFLDALLPVCGKCFDEKIDSLDDNGANNDNS